jgi:Stage II sporulation protein M
MSTNDSLQPIPLQDVPLAAVDARLRHGTFCWDWLALGRCARALFVVTVVSFVLGVGGGALMPGLPTGLLSALQRLAFWPSDYVSGLVPVYLLILLGNMRAAFIMGLLGPLSVWANAALNERDRAAGRHAERLSLPQRVAVALGSACVAAGRRIFPALGDDTREFAARSSAGLAAVVPFLALGLNAAAAGLWLADGLLSGWTHGLAEALCGLLPHGPLEFTALLLAAAAGLNGAEALVPRAEAHDSSWQRRVAREWLTSDRVAQSLGLLIGLIAISAALELTHFG